MREQNHRVAEDVTLAEGMARLNELPMQFMVVMNGSRIVGTVTDGDIRRAILSGVPLDAPLSRAMNPSPVTATSEMTRAELYSLMTELGIRFVPLVAEGGVLERIVCIDDVRGDGLVDQALIMAGGLGMRLRPHTENTPKPMLEIGGTPLLETLVRQLAGYGFNHVALSINYLGDQIRDHFGDGSRFGVRVSYITETERMGTAGAASLMDPLPMRPLLVMNGDILTSINFRAFMEFHHSTGADLTMGVRTFQQQVPYGVVNTRGLEITSIEEKPTLDFFVNAGLYVIEPDVLASLAQEPLDMTDLVERLLSEGGRRVAACPVHEYWQDIGREEDLFRAREDYGQIFDLKPLS